MSLVAIDLGTTYSLCSVYKDNTPQIIPNIHGELMTASAVCLNDNSEIIIGKAAIDYGISGKHECIKGFKRFMGTNKSFVLGKNSYKAEELSALILQSLKKDAEEYLGADVTTAIISVPAYFNNKQREATKIAGELAGLNVVRLVNEPTAAALSYGLQNKEGSKYLVFDLGGGTFDVTIMQLSDGILEARATAGDNYLGGDDFTQEIVDDFCQKKGFSYSSLDDSTKNKLWVMAENCKLKICKLSKNDNATLKVTIDREEYSYCYSAEELELIFNPLLVRLLHPVTRAMNDSNLKAEDIDSVVFVGGATKLPALKKLIVKSFKKIPYLYHDPQVVVAYGAAVLSGMYENQKDLEEMVLVDVIPYTLGTSSVVGDEYTGYKVEYIPIIERNTIIPTSKSKEFFTTVEWQEKLCIDVYQGESINPDNNIKISSFKINIDTPSKELQALQIRFSYDLSGLLEVQVYFYKSGSTKTKLIKESCSDLSDEQIANSLSRFKSLKVHPRDLDINLALLARADRLYQESLGDIRTQISERCRVFEAVLNKQNDKNIKLIRKQFKEFLDSLEREHV